MSTSHSPRDSQDSLQTAVELSEQLLEMELSRSCNGHCDTAWTCKGKLQHSRDGDIMELSRSFHTVATELDV